jgi:hypothetical protein
MIIENLLQNPWVISILSAILTAIIIPISIYIIKYIRSLFGVFSGQYLAITGNIFDGPILIEDVVCHHINNRLRGTIRGVAIIEYKAKNQSLSIISESHTSYKFTGYIDERLLVISYFSKLKGVQSTGTISLKCDSSGRIFSGVWSGIVTEFIESSHCIWIRMIPKISSTRKKDEFLSNAKTFLTHLNNNSNFQFNPTKRNTFINRKPGLGKSILVFEPHGKSSLINLFENKKHKK